MQLNGFVQSSADPCVYIQVTDTLSVGAVYVADLIIITATTGVMQSIKQSLSDPFKIKDRGNLLHYCPEVNVVHDGEDCIWLHQKQYNYCYWSQQQN